MRTGGLGRIGGAKEEGEDKRRKDGIDVGQGELPSNTVAQGSQETEQAAAMSISDATSYRNIPTRPLLDEAISWDRITGASKNEGKRKWWRMP
ncbi:hypothetical protein FRC12_014941 [Ceratobasidium sp. 428]|nr:hypothetical protein FRC12_014941 [Ceratobasidium sp. 428]